jgi:DNA-binding transcriptional LysR family regulator
VARLTERHPDIDLTVLDDHRQGLLPRLARWELDLALIYDHPALPDAEVELERTPTWRWRTRARALTARP